MDVELDTNTNNEDEATAAEVDTEEILESLNNVDAPESDIANAVENTTSESAGSANKKNSKKDATEKQRVWQLPLSKVKSIMKLDPDCNIVAKDAIFLTTGATELFLQAVAKEMVKYTQMGKRKTILKKDLDNAINNSSSLCFLDGTLEQLCSQ